MSNPFEDHGLTHISASQLNTFAAEPAVWVLTHLIGFKSPLSPPAARGISSESGVQHLLVHPDAPIQDGIDVALKQYDRMMALNNSEKKEKERNGISGMVENGAAELRQYGVPKFPEEGQQYIEAKIDGVGVPVIGYLDFDYPQHGIIVDLKTTLRLPSVISPTHARQGAIYSRSRGDNVDMRFAYVTPKKIGVYSLEADQLREAWNAVEQIALRMQRFLALSKDKDELAALVCPNYETFYWNDAVLRGAGRELYGF
jgi:hypothetical protein